MEVEARIVRLQLAETFVIAREATDYADVVHVSVTHDGVTGHGEAAPIERYGESAQSAIASSTSTARLVGDDPFALEDIGERLASIPGRAGGEGGARRGAPRPPGKAPRRSRRSGCSGCRGPGRRPRGRSGSAIPTTWPGAPRRRAATYRRLKLKLGGGDGLDVERVRAVRGVTDLPLMVDVNEWWSLDEALDALPQLAELGVEYCEQPLRAGDEGGRELKERSPIPIYVDEDCHTLADVGDLRRDRARDQHQAREVGRHPRGDPHGARRARAAHGRDARLHARVGPRDRGRLLRRAALRPRRPRREPPAARGPVARRRARRRRAGALARRRVSACLRPREHARARILILGEGFSHDPHYGKTMRGIIRYGPDPVVAILDSQRAGGDHEGIPIVGTVEDALPFEPTVAVVGVATQGGRFPPAWRELLKACIAAGLDVESGLHEFISEDPELTRARATRTASSCATCASRPRASASRPARTSRSTRRSSSPSAPTARSGRRRSRSSSTSRRAGAGSSRSSCRPGQTGIAIAGWGIAVDAVVSDFLAGAAEWLVVEGARRGGKLLFVEGQGSLVHPMYSGVTLGLVHGSAPHALRPLSLRPARPRSKARPGTRSRRSASSSSCTSAIALPARKAKVACVALNTAAHRERRRRARARSPRSRDETGLPTDDPVRFGAQHLLDALLARL